MSGLLMKGLVGAVIAAMCLCAPAAAMENDGDCLYTLTDGAGNVLTMRAGRMFEGDEYIAGDNRHYRIAAVDDGTMTAVAEEISDTVAVFSEGRDEKSDENEKDGKKLICMYSTHSDECYVPSDGESSKWEDAGIYDVGNRLKDEFEKLGIETVYSEETFLPHDADAYTRSRATAEELLKKGPDALLDIHRDAIPAEMYETTVDGDDISMVRLFVGRSNQNAAANKAFAKEIKRVADEKYPGLIKDIYIGKGNYNQELYPRALLLEMGTHEIEKEKAMGAAEYIADVINDVLYGPSAKAETGKAENRASAAKGIAWAVGLAVLAAVVYAVVSTGGFKAAGEKLKRGASEISGGLFGKKNKK